jgi:hypothetical protein
VRTSGRVLVTKIGQNCAVARGRAGIRPAGGVPGWNQRVPAMIKPIPADSRPMVSEAVIHNKMKSLLGFCGSRPVTERKNPVAVGQRP